MADEQKKDLAATDKAPAPSAETKKAEPGETQEQPMIPKSRFDEINEARKVAEKALEALQREKEAAEKAKAEEQGEFERLYREAQEQVSSLQGEVKRRDLDLLRRQVAQEVGIPNLWNRLQGEDEAAIKKDAEVLKSAMPKPQAPSLDGGAGRRDRGEPAETMTPGQVQEFAAIFNLDPKAVAKVLGRE